jgi:alkyldihydroxyacetonephosphate synthase
MTSAWQRFVEDAKKFYVVNIKGYKPDQLTACTLLFEGDKETCEANCKKVMSMAKDFNGMAGGPENGLRGYLLTFLIAYSRDLAMRYHVAAESFETSCPWSNVSALCSRTKQRIIDEAMKLGYARADIWVSFRLTQMYETGGVVYVYLSLAHKGTRKDIVDEYSIVEDAARDEVMLAGGSISHHHGVGKLRKQFMPRSLPPMAI